MPALKRYSLLALILLAAGMLALSCYAVYFSRNAYPQWVSVFPLLLAVWCHARWDAIERAENGGRLCGKAAAYLLGCGAFAGLGFWTNYQIAGALTLLVVLHGAPFNARVILFR